MSYLHRLVERLFVVFSFKILLTGLLMTESLSMVDSHSLVLLELKSCIFKVYLFYLLDVILRWV